MQTASADSTSPHSFALVKVTATGHGYITRYADGVKVYSLTPVRRVATKQGAHVASVSFAPSGAASGKDDTTVRALGSSGGVPSAIDMLKALGAPDSVLQKFAHFDDDGTASPTSAPATTPTSATATMSSASTSRTTWTVWWE